MHTQLVVFDIAGTTVRDEGNINQCFQESFGEAGVRQVSAADVNAVMGYRKMEAIKIIMDQYAPGKVAADPGILYRIHDVFSRKMVSFYQEDPDLEPLPYALESFEWLGKQGIKVGLDTGFTREITDAILTRLGWKQSPLIHAVVCSDEVPEGRPYPYMIRSLMQQTSISDPLQVVKIGDTAVDIEEGRNAGCGSVIAVATGAYSSAQLQLHHPDHLIQSLLELPALIQ